MSVTLDDIKKKLKEIEPTIDFLHELIGVGRFASLIKTSDGFWMGMDYGDIGYNSFLGNPSENALARGQNSISKMEAPMRGALYRYLVSRYGMGRDVAALFEGQDISALSKEA